MEEGECDRAEGVIIANICLACAHDMQLRRLPKNVSTVVFSQQRCFAVHTLTATLPLSHPLSSLCRFYEMYASLFTSRCSVFALYSPILGNLLPLQSERAATPQGAAGRCSGQQLSSIAALPLLPPRWALDTLVSRAGKGFPSSTGPSSQLSIPPLPLQSERAATPRGV